MSPEIHQLVTEWDTLPSDKRGELAGYAFGKHGADIAAPGAVAKIASKSAKGARELAAVLKNLQRAEGTLVLETAAGVGNTARVGEIISNGKNTALLADKLGFTAREMGQLKQAGKLETTLMSKLLSEGKLVPTLGQIPPTQASSVIGWKVGDNITHLTSAGKVPKWSTVRQRYWKNKAFYAGDNYDSYNLARMKKGLAPQEMNRATGVLESMELHHIPSQKDGGLFDFIEVTPSEHAKLDKFRRIKK